MACTLSSTTNHTKGFDFAELYNVYLYLNHTCAPESDIFSSGTRMLTAAVCRKMTRTSTSIWSGWTPYPISDIWTRIAVWKLPLLQLISQFPRPPLGPSVETGVMLHLLGDPIDSVASMLLTLAVCQTRVERAKELCVHTGVDCTHPGYHRTWKGLAIIMASYDECGASAKIENFCTTYREMRGKPSFDSEIRHIYEETAGSLAADRQTRTLPVVIAELFFIGGWVISLVKAASSEPNPTNWVNVEAQSIAISALFLWVTSAVVIASVIGASQTEDAVPRILHAFEYHISAFLGGRARRPSIQERIETTWCRKSIDRAVHGGTYSWRPTKWKEDWPKSSVLFAYAAIGTILVSSSFFISALLSYLVSPKGFNCRHIPEAMVLAIWLLSSVIEIICERYLNRRLFWVIFWKDTLCALSNIAIIIVVQWGIMNRCSCWSGWGSTGLHLPQMPDVKPELMFFIRHIAPWIVLGAVVFHLVFCAVVIWKYWDAVRVYIQRDDGVSNLGWENRRRDKSNTYVSEHGSKS
ncbi:uncharacterized protein K460DRAFT_360626 [Cucurbitaria berberidis CBS 394.84]|uniref:Transmembrane protein n=1 Tax=Cucurbitaria berberidis CBS 394.84 TaxID=1168544 RepID=A0A9P4LCJ4_9PLEO|nr:uncharacterized protein K460DRAFT_360626 [Cucurbitaria berberidis CBS 394.84]KAF1849773.1 hypothetical protein K460DRAFT_360626 [Cucurbitaria berberidis CBS 394.84]